MDITVKFDSSLKFYFVAIDDSTFKTTQSQKLYLLWHRSTPASDNVPAFANVTMTCILWSKEKIERISGVASVDNWRGEYSYLCVHRP